MPKALTRKELIRRFRALGYHGPYSGGKHQFMQQGVKKIRIPNPHAQDRISAGLIGELLRQAGIDKDQWEKL